MADAAAAVRVQSLVGRPVAAVSPVPDTVGALKAELETHCGVPAGLQRLLRGLELLADGDALGAEDACLTLVVDESPLYSWDVAGNPNRGLLGGCGTEVVFEEEDCDYVNVVTREPVRSGRHFFEFVMHQLGDEQWCGVCADRSRAGNHGSRDGWFYYSGRRSKGSWGALHAPCERQALGRFAHVASGDVIGLVLDVDEGAAAFALNGALQGACAVPREPLYLTTSLDRAQDRVELRKPPLADAPPEALAALAGPLLGVQATSDGSSSSDEGTAHGLFAESESGSSLGGAPAQQAMAARGWGDRGSMEEAVRAAPPSMLSCCYAWLLAWRRARGH